MENLNTTEVKITPAEYFEQVKSKKENMTDETLKKIYENCLELYNKYKETGQIRGMRKLAFHLMNIEKEYKLLDVGINSFVYKSEIEDYIQNVSDRVVKICELADYEREIPDDIVYMISKTKEIFDMFFVVYTDYTGETERWVQEDKRLKDPILFGAFLNRDVGVVVERFYFVGDWEDEYCDLTLDKMVSEVRKKKNKEIVMNFDSPITMEELKAQLDNLQPEGESFRQINPTVKVKKEKKHRNLFGVITGKFFK